MESRTLCDIFYAAVDTHVKPAHLLRKAGGAWEGISSYDFRRAVEELSLGLRALGLEKGERVALLSENRPEWAFVDLATLTAGAVDVPIYATLTPAQVLYILSDSQARICVVSNVAQLRKVAEVRAQATHLKHVIRMDESAGPAPDGPAPDTLTLDEVRARGREALARDPGAVRALAAEVKADDLATLIYTSGTTGDPKGVMLTHDNIVSNVRASLQVLSDFSAQDTALSFLPLCHIFERMAGYYLMLAAGASIAYAEGVEQVPANMAEVRPTLMCSVPRLYEKMYARILEKVASDPPLRRRIFKWAMAVGREMFRHRVEKTQPGPLLRFQAGLAEGLVFSKIKQRVGGRLRLFVSGGRPWPGRSRSSSAPPGSPSSRATA